MSCYCPPLVPRAVVLALTGIAVVALGIGIYLSFAPMGSPPAPTAPSGSNAAISSAPDVTAAPPVAAPPPVKAEPAPKPAPVPVRPPEPAAPPTTATIKFESDVPGASVFLDRVYLGTTPITVPDVKPGAHRVNASATGYDGIAENIDVVPGPRDIMLKFKEIRLDVTVAVVHKHGIGSCAGRLVATPQGVKYETTNEGDRFDVPLEGIGELELDYLGKKLRIKLKTGKNYNFTETGGGADQLYAFHRDVEAAIKKKKALFDRP